MTTDQQRSPIAPWLHRVLGNGPHCHVSLRTATSEIMSMAVSSCMPFSSTMRPEDMTTSDKCTFPILSCYTCLPPGKCKRLRPQHIATVVSNQEFYSLFLNINVTTFTYINIAHKTRNSNLHPRTS